MDQADHLDELLVCRLDFGRKAVEPCSVVIFGASGDLTARKLMPAFYHLFTEKQLPSPFRIIGFARREKSDPSWREEMKSALQKYSRNKTLDAAQKAARLAALDKKLPAALREEREAPARIVNTEAAVQQLRKQGAGDDEVYRLRAAAFSPEAAGRLADLDREEADWQRRIALYLAQRSNSGAMDAAALQQLRDKHFSAAEQRRLGAYE